MKGENFCFRNWGMSWARPSQNLRSRFSFQSFCEAQKGFSLLPITIGTFAQPNYAFIFLKEEIFFGFWLE